MHALTALVALLTPAAAPQPPAPQTPSWLNDYPEARKRGAREGRPLAVFFGRGARAWQSLTFGKTLSAEAQRLLAGRYVCVAVDVGSPRGKRLASAFDIRSGCGLVLSTRDGEDQAFSHDGMMTCRELLGSLKGYSNGRPVAATRTLRKRSASPPTRTSAYAAPAAPGGAFTGGFSGFGGFGGFGGGGC
jgi:hypothetical protein